MSDDAACQVQEMTEISHEDAQAPARILSICCLYPNSLHPGQGLFCAAPATTPVGDCGSAGNRAFRRHAIWEPERREYSYPGRSSPVRTQAGGVSVLHPRWFYPPLSGSLTGLWLALRLLPLLTRLRKEFPFAVIDTHFGHPEGVAGALLSGALKIPFTMTLRGNEPKHSRSRMERFWMAWALRRASRVFTVSGRLRRFRDRIGGRGLQGPRHPQWNRCVRVLPA